MKIVIDKNKCVGCGLCRHTAPALFYIDGYHAEPFADSELILTDDELLQCRLHEIMDICPTGAVSLDHGKEDDHLSDNGYSDRIIAFKFSKTSMGE